MCDGCICEGCMQLALLAYKALCPVCVRVNVGESTTLSLDSAGYLLEYTYIHACCYLRQSRQRGMKSDRTSQAEMCMR